ncbi:inositol monophosphatase family protein [Devosia honganensis]|uniref:Inositol monophosphatase family protein n=1 Tax=Devosia honganensis TaxID=1610527 RepID=A0ABV7WXJ6_9HYPH
MQAIVETIARQAGDLAMAHFGRLASVAVESKGHLDLVTAADKEVEAFVIGELRKAFPDDGVFGEEGGAVSSRSGRVWVIDPIDGTFNFVRGGDQWAVSIGLYEGGAPRFGVINAPARAQLVAGGEGIPATLNGEPLAARQGMDRSKASAGVGFHPVIPVEDRLEMLRFVLEDARMVFRCCGSATISLLEIASGEVDGYIGMGESTWDLMAALPILAQLGVHSTVDWSDISLEAKLKFACGTPDFLELVAPAVPFGSVLSR